MFRSKQPQNLYKANQKKDRHTNNGYTILPRPLLRIIKQNVNRT